MRVLDERPPTQRQRRARSTERLIAALVESIAEKGFERTTAAEIGARAGYSRSIVGVQYGSKQRLVRSLVRTRLEDWRPVRRPPGITGLDWLTSRIDALAEQARTDELLVRALVAVCFESLSATNGSLTPLKADVAAWLDEHRAAVADAILAGQQDGSVRRGLDPVAAATRVLDLEIAWLVRWAMSPAHATSDSALSSIKDGLTFMLAPVGPGSRLVDALPS